MAKRNSDEILNGSALTLSAELDAVGPTFIEKLQSFCATIQQYGLKPWGRKGRHYFNDGINVLLQDGGFDRLTICEKCREGFLIRTDPSVVELFLQYWREELEYEEWVKCAKCGGQIEWKTCD